jgi:hypothetical protein
MRRVVPCLLVTGLIVLTGTGCRGRQQRPYYSDPFGAPPQASARRSPVVTESLLTPHDSQAPEVTHAGGEYKPYTADKSEVNRSGRDFRLPEEDDLDHSKVPPKSAALPDRPRSGATMDHAPDYSWIQGRLEYSALSGGVWKVRYAPISADDEHGGSVILESAPDASRFQAGDTVYVEGRIIPSDQRRALHNPAYQVQRMRIVEE